MKDEIVVSGTRVNVKSGITMNRIFSQSLSRYPFTDHSVSEDEQLGDKYANCLDRDS